MVTDGSYRQLTRHIMAVYRQATPLQIREGLAWYDAAYTEVEKIVFYAPLQFGPWSRLDMTRAVIALAQLSPRVRWDRNLQLLAIMTAFGDRPPDALRRSWNTAWRSLVVDDPWTTFGSSARKTRSFAKAILGDPRAVPVDIWAARVAGVEEHVIKTARGYVAVAEAYRRAAKIAAVEPRQIQAITWIVTRGDAR